MPAPIQGAPEHLQKQFSFLVEADGLEGPGKFTAVSGLTMTVANISYREGGSRFAINLDGFPEFGDVTLTQGLVLTRTSLYDWMMLAVEGNYADVVERDVLIVPLDDAEQPQSKAILLSQAKPREFEFGAFDASTQEVAVSRLVLKPTRMELIDRPA